MRCSAALALLPVLWVIGCGGGDDGDAAAPEPTATAEATRADETSSECTGEALSARDVIGPAPSGYAVDPGDRDVLEQLGRPVIERLDDALREWDANVLIRDGERIGVVVFVFNATDKSEPGDALRGLQEALDERGGQAENLTVAGHPGRLVNGPNGAVALTDANRCATVMLVGSREARVRRAAAVMRPEPSAWE